MSASDSSRTFADRGLGIAYGVGAGAVWGLAFLAPALVAEFPPLYVSVARFLLFGLIAGMLLVPRWSAVGKHLTRRHFRTLFALAIVGNTLFYAALVQGVQWGGVAMVALVMGFVPVLVTVIGSREQGAVPLRYLLPSLVLCVLGAVFMALNALGDDQSPEPLLGLMAAVLGLVCWTVYAVANARALRNLIGITAHDWNLLLGVVTGLQALLMLPLLALLPSSNYTAMQWWSLLGVATGLAVLCSLVGYTFWNRMSQLLPMTMIGQMIVFETIFALSYGLLWEARLPTLYEGLALVCVLLGMFACVVAHRVPQAPQVPLAEPRR